MEANIEINEGLLDERYDLLHKSVTKFIKSVKQKNKDKQLQYYRACSSFDATSYMEIFEDVLEEQRQQYIISIRQEIDHLIYQININQAKLARKNKVTLNDTKTLRDKNSQLQNIYSSFSNRLNHLKDSQEKTEQMYINKINCYQNRIDLTQKLVHQLKNVQNSFNLLLKDIKEELSTDSSCFPDILQTYLKRFQSQMQQRIQESVMTLREKDQTRLFHLKSEIEHFKLKNQELTIASQTVFDYLKQISGVPEAKTTQNIKKSIPDFIDNLRKGVVKKYLSESKLKFLDKNADIESGNFVKTINQVLKTGYEEREKQFERLDSFGRKKRLHIQNELEKALNKLNSFERRHIPNDLIDELQLSDINFKESSQQLDKTIKILSSSPFLSNITKV